MTKLGATSTPLFSYVMDYKDTKILVETLSHNLRNSPEGVPISPSTLSTDLALRALMLMQQGVTFDDSFEDCCHEAEARLLDGISPYAVSNPSINSPVVVTHENQPVGVIKRNKVRTMYAIADVFDHNIVNGAFHSITNDFRPEAPSANHAWSVDLKDEAAPTFEPVRLSVFTIPLEERLKLLHFEDPNDTLAKVALQGSHEKIIECILAAQKNAVPIAESSISA